MICADCCLNHLFLIGLQEVLSKYWWAILLGCIVLVVIIALLIKLCAVYTPSHNPDREERAPAKKLPGRKRQTPQRSGMEMR